MAASSFAWSAAGSGGDDRAATPSELDQPVVPEQLIGPEHGVHVEVERGGELAGGGQPLTGLEHTLGHGEAYLRDELGEERLIQRGVDAEEHA